MLTPLPHDDSGSILSLYKTHPAQHRIQPAVRSYTTIIDPISNNDRLNTWGLFFLHGSFGEAEVRVVRVGSRVPVCDVVFWWFLCGVFVARVL